MAPDQSGLSGRRLAIVVRSLEVGGAERQAALLARSLDRGTGANVEVWCFSLDGRNRRILQESGIQVVEISPGGSGRWFTRVVQMIRFVAAARRRKADLLIPFTDHPNKVCGAMWPLLGSMGSIWNQRDEGREVTGRPIERAALRLTTLFTCNSSSGELFLRDKMAVDENRIVRVRNWVLPEEPLKTPSEWRRELEVDPQVPLATMIGNLHRFKDHATLIRSWRIVLDRMEGPAPVLILAGRPDSEAASLGSLAGELGLDDEVRFLGEIDDVSGLLATVDLVVHSSRREGSPNGVLEAMAAGVPIIATDIEGTSEALGETYPGLVPGGDEACLATRILQMFEDRGFRQRLGELARSRFTEHYSPEQALADYTSVLERVIQEKTR